MNSRSNSTLARSTPALGTQAPGTSAPGPSAWHIVTGEYPPTGGGVSDYTFAVANALASAGDEVNVWCPAGANPAFEHPQSASRVNVHPIAGTWSARDLARVDAALDALPAPRRLLVQWVPHAFGKRSVNVRFCRWVRSRARHGDVLDLMVHEPGLGFGEGSFAHNAAAALHRLMLTLLLSNARRVWISIPAWGDTLRRFAVGRADLEFRWLPIPSTIAVDRSRDVAARLRAQTLIRRDGVIVGHFSTYPADVRNALREIVPPLLASFPEVQVQLLGRGSEAAAEELQAVAGLRAERIKASGDLGSTALSSHLQICDVMLQPYADGASTRRTTLMAALAHGIPAVTTYGRLSEHFWRSTDAVAVAPAGDTAAIGAALSELLRDPARRRQMAVLARETYEQRFSLRRVVDTLRRDASEAAS